VNERSGRKNQEHKYSEKEQVDAALQNICLSAGKRDHTHCQRQQ
jgi:hypothetical protein